MSRKRSLGRGLDALLPPRPQPATSGPPSPGPAVPLGVSAVETSAAGPADPATLPIDRLEPNRQQPRQRFDPAALTELAESIQSKGLIQPIVVTLRGASQQPADGGAAVLYTIVAGERRWRAARQAGLTEVPVVVREVADDRDLLELALVENLQRSDLDPIEEASAYQSLQEDFGLSQKEIAAKVGKSRPAVSNALRLLNLPAEVIDMLQTGELSAGQARPLLALETAREQLDLALETVRKGLSARDLEARVSAPPAPAKKRQPSPMEVHAAAAAERLTQHLHAPVEIRRKKRGGEVRIRFHSEEELMRIYDLMLDLHTVDDGEG